MGKRWLNHDRKHEIIARKNRNGTKFVFIFFNVKISDIHKSYLHTVDRFRRTIVKFLSYFTINFIESNIIANTIERKIMGYSKVRE